MVNFKKIFEEYSIDTTIFSEESPKVRAIKSVIFNDLTEIDRRVILLYAELQSQRKVAAMLGISPSSVNMIVKEIRKKIFEKLC